MVDRNGPHDDLPELEGALKDLRLANLRAACYEAIEAARLRRELEEFLGDLLGS
jgi:hypothetical protein